MSRRLSAQAIIPVAGFFVPGPAALDNAMPGGSGGMVNDAAGVTPPVAAAGPAAAVTVELITEEAALVALIPEWDALAATLVPWTPFATPTWNLTHWRHFRRRRLTVRDDLRCFVIRDADGALVAIAPMLVTKRPGFGPGVLRSLVFFGVDTNVTEFRGLICRPADEARAVAALIDALAARRGEWDWLHWGMVQHDGNARNDILARMTPAIERSVPVFYIDLPDNFAALRARLSRNTKEALRKCYNSLKRAGHHFSFEIVTEPQQVDAALDIFFRLHAARANANYTVVHPNAFAWPEAERFLRDYAKRSAARGELRIFQLRIAGEVVATRIAFCSGTDLYFYYSGHLPAFGKHSVMTTVVAEAMKWAIENGLQRVHLSMGRDRSKLRWEPHEIVLAESYQPADSFRGRRMRAMFNLRHHQPELWGRPGRPAGQGTDPATD